MLTLLTFADSLGTSDDLWNDFKNSLLQSLYRRAGRRIASVEDYETGEKNSLWQKRIKKREKSSSVSTATREVMIITRSLLTGETLSSATSVMNCGYGDQQE